MHLDHPPRDSEPEAKPAEAAVDAGVRLAEPLEDVRKEGGLDSNARVGHFDDRAAADGLDLASRFRPDVVISDIGMPEVDGYQFIRKLRTTPGFQRVPAIALTGYAREEDRLNAIAAGYDAHIAKPAEMHRLVDLMKKLTWR